MSELIHEVTTPHAEPLLDVHGLALQREARFLHDVSFSLAPGEVLAVVGPSGCGKSTLLLALAGFEECSGEIRVEGTSLQGVVPQRRPSSLVFQSPTLFERMSVRENIAFGLHGKALGAKHAHDLVEAAMTRMGIIALADRYPDALSGGQAQRVALARALVTRPKVLLLDEPLAHVGASLAAAIRQTLLREVRRLKIAALYVTHDVEEACLVGDRLLIMDAGRVLQIGAPRELYERPNSEAVARLMGIPSVLACEVEEIVSEQTALVRCGSASFHVPAPRVKDCGGADSEDVASRGAASGGEDEALGDEVGGAGGVKDSGGDNVVFAKRSLLSLGPALLAMPGEAIELLAAPPSAIIGRHAQVIGAFFVRGIMVYDLETEFGTLVAMDSSVREPFTLGNHVEFEFRGG
ncbi:ABC transporter ATP-binding protein [Schaalia cardiffensis]